MVRRLFWLSLPTLLSQVSLANDVAWNCQQDKNSKEWACVGDKNPVSQASPLDGNNVKTLTKNNPEPANLRAAQPGTVKPVGVPKSQARPVIKQPAPVASPNVQPVSPEPANAVAPVNPDAPPVSKAKLVEAPAVPENALPAVPSTLGKAVEPMPQVVGNTAENAEAGSDITEPAKATGLVEERPPVSEASADKPKMPGWHCGADGGNDAWDCKLVGADPKGKAQAVKASDDGSGWSLLDPVFSRQEENIFSNLNDRFPVDPWAGCGIEMQARKKKPTDKKLREESPLDMNSNYSEIFDNEVGNYTGNVDMSRADQRAASHAAHYDTVSEVLDLHGDVFYSEDEIGIYTDSATLKLATDEARLRDGLFISPTTPIRGRAKAIYRDSEFLSRYRDAAYTSCRPGNQDWAVHASQLKLNKQTGKGAAKNAWLEFKGVPVFYSPYLSFPMDDRRMTGFLAPVFGNTRSNGFDISTPFYWNIAPNYDATLRPRYLTERGILLGGDLRYLTENMHGEFSGEFLPDDGKREGNASNDNTSTDTNPNFGKSRYLLALDNYARFTPNLTSVLDLNYVSDKNYFSDLGNALSFTNFRTIKSSANLKYIDDGIRLTGQVVNYQIVDPSVTGRNVPYRMLPQINLAMNRAFEVMKLPVYTDLDSEFVYFQQDGGALPEGQRLNIKPSVSLPWKSEAAYITPKASLQYTQYILENQAKDKPDTISRVLPILSVDSGLYLERNLDIAGTTLKHTLEPRLFYLYVPRTDQKDIPVFDSSIYDFRYSSMFRENRFSGADRVQDANQFTLALTSRFIDPASGKERLKLNIGSILYLQDRDVSLATWNQDGITTYEKYPERTSFKQQRFSNLVVEATSQLNDHFTADAGIQWNPQTNNVERGSVGVHFVNHPGELVNLGFQFRKDRGKCTKNDVGVPGCENFAKGNTNNTDIINGNDIVVSDASFRWPIYDDWYGIGRWQYSWLYGRTQEAFLGFEKENCCWRFRLIGRRYFSGLTNINTAQNQTVDLNTAEAQTGVFFQIELKGLTGIGEKLDEFFERNIYGYHKPQK